MRTRALSGVVIVGLLAAPRGANAHPSLDWVGVEISPLSLNAGTPTANSNITATPSRMSLVPGLTLRVGQHRFASWYWTPGQLTFVYGGRGAPGAPITLAALATEAGFIQAVGDHTVFEAGLAAGVGGLEIEVAYDCDGSCGLGGWGAMVAPVVRLTRRLDASLMKSAGIFARAAVPLQTNTFLGANVGFGMIALFGVDLAFGARAR
jgi:hypothetical protein